MTTLKALLVGVTRHTNPAPTPAITVNRPWAALDVGSMYDLIESLVPATNVPGTGPASGAFDAIENVALVGEAETTLAQIKEGLKWLWKPPETGGEAMRLFYFSGHAMLTSLPSGNMAEVLLPSDTDWNLSNPVCLRNRDLLPAASGGKEIEGSLEVVLEACSASVFALGTTHPFPLLIPFGCGFPGSVVVWGASQVQQHSHSGSVPPCERSEIQGLFTHFFCEEFPKLGLTGTKGSRQQLLDTVHRDLQKYAAMFEECCDCCEEMEQAPALYCSDADALNRPLSSTSDAAPGSPRKGCPKTRLPGSGRVEK